MADNIKEVNNQINAKLGISSDCQTTYEAVREQVKKLGGDLSKVHDIYTGELEVLEYISGEPNLQDKSVSITENGELDVKPDEGFDGLSNVTIETNVQPSLQDKSVNITENNSTTAVNADDDYYGLKSVNVNVNIPITDAMDVSYTENGIYEITPDPGDEGIKKINVSVEVESSCPLSFADINYYNSDDVQTDLTYSKTKLDAWDPTRTSAYSLYYNNKTLKYAPKIDTSNVTSMQYMFRDCFNLTSVPLFDTSKVTNMDSMFDSCSSLTYVPQFDTSNVTDISWMFYNCSSLTSVPLFDTSKVTNMYSMFNNCLKLTSVPQFDTSKVTSMQYMFYNCSSLTTVPQFNTTNVTNMLYMFYKCYNLTSVPLFDTSKVTNMNSMFGSCSSLTTVGGFTDLGKAFTSAQTFDLSYCPLTSESVTNIANTVYDMNQNTSIQTQTIKFSSTVYSALTDEQKTLFANKGWTVTA